LEKLDPQNATKVEDDEEDYSMKNKKLISIDPEVYQEQINKMQTYSKYCIIFILVWTFLSGSKNSDFLWSYINAL